MPTAWSTARSLDQPRSARRATGSNTGGPDGAPQTGRRRASRAGQPRRDEACEEVRTFRRAVNLSSLDCLNVQRYLWAAVDEPAGAFAHARPAFDFLRECPRVCAWIRPVAAWWASSQNPMLPGGRGPRVCPQASRGPPNRSRSLCAAWRESRVRRRSTFCWCPARSSPHPGTGLPGGHRMTRWPSLTSVIART